MSDRPDKLKPALMAGAFIGLIASIPIISLINCFCCAGVILGGVLAVNLYRKDLQGSDLTSADGVMLGWMAGASGALFSTMLTSIITGGVKHQISKVLEYSGEMPPELEEALLKLQEMGSNLFFTILVLILSLIIYSIFGIIGGLIGVSMLKKKRMSP
ncbi:MAG: hypothetical protein ONB27_15855 [candidate division KSB1 bacterium]|nr:hypothetical protein [candidate division KSB1 bacterium]